MAGVLSFILLSNLRYFASFSIFHPPFSIFHPLFYPLHPHLRIVIGHATGGVSHATPDEYVAFRPMDLQAAACNWRKEAKAQKN
jgi:hypothetical protein